ncbi:hypothetical protein [Paractinoplanes durhamensis]|uniref:Uncharacterized protein n=1 Tax=Paractinoplanes durhamensis TaxID=113563 RepID=A0ABQ3YXS5_9ACTN|nr:hypothetical protein [Actinoplanes durhamensis]GIE02373.1 hypothetical protein Adu01nite_37230 [Actinoplanes durhamensis]
MVTRRTLFGAAAGAGAITLVPGTAEAAGRSTFNGWRIDPGAITEYRIEGSRATVLLRTGAAAAVLLHVARRWHYEIAPLDTGEGGVTAFSTDRTAGAAFESAYLSGTAIALHPHAYPLGGSETLWPHQEAIVRDILADLDGTVVWGGDLKPAKLSHFHLAVGPADKTLRAVAARVDTSRPVRVRRQTAGAVADPADHRAGRRPGV